MISDAEDSAALMIPEDEHFNENDDSYPNGAQAGRTAQDVRPKCKSLTCLEEVAG